MKINEIYNVIDVESTCWGPKEVKPKEEFSEIIEIGISSFNLKTLELLENASYIIKPVHSKVSDFCTNLTGHTDASLSGAPTFKEVLNKLIIDFNIIKRMWGSWGDYDRNMLMGSCTQNKIPYYSYFPPRHQNIKMLMALQEGLTNELSLQKAINFYKLNFVGIPHRGKDDAYNISKIMTLMLGNFRK